MPVRLASQPASRIVPIVATIIAIAIVCFEGLDVSRKLRDTLAQTDRISKSLTDLSAEYFARTFEAIDRTLLAASEAFEEFHGGEMDEGEAARMRAHEVLRTIHGGAPALIGIAWVNASGTMIARSASQSPVPFSYALHPVVAEHRDKEIGLYISEPALSRVNGRWFILVSRRLRGADGGFLGTVQASLNIDYFIQTYSNLHAVDAGVVSLFNIRNGNLLLFGAESRAYLGRSVTDIAAFKIPDRSGPGAIAMRSTALNGQDRILSYRRVGDFPLIVAVGFSMDSILATWRQELIVTGAVALLLAGFAIGGGIALGRLLANREREITSQRNADISNRAKSEFLATVSHELRTPLNGIIGYAELLAETTLTAAQRHDVEVIDTSARALHNLLNDVLDASRIEAGRLALVEMPIDLMQTIDGAVSTMRGAARSA